MKYTVPNWFQSLIAKAIGLDPKGIAVRSDDDRSIVFLEHKPHREILVSKITGEITYL